MGDHHQPCFQLQRRPGVAIVRPKLHEDTKEHRDLFRRWTKMHMRDTLSLPKDMDLGGASKVLRYSRAAEDGSEEYFYTIVLDDVRLPGTEAFQKIPQRLDLENTRELREGEEPVLQAGDKRMETEPMVFSIVSPVVGLFEEMRNADLERTKNDLWISYQNLPLEIATLGNAMTCRLVTLTISARGSVNASLHTVRKIHSSLVKFLATATQRLLYTSLYNHSADAQPGALPKIPAGDHGHGDWVACVLFGGDADKKLLDAGLHGVEGQVEEWVKRMALHGSMEGVTIKTGVWNGDVFMS